jgi:hypothetical protein
LARFHASVKKSSMPWRRRSKYACVNMILFHRGDDLCDL